MTHDAQLRSYDVLRPNSSAGATPVALVVDLNGAGSNSNEQRGISGWSTIANANGLLVA
jgi:poly(3-hydroxybutyrate) depolymerase